MLPTAYAAVTDLTVLSQRARRRKRELSFEEGDELCYKAPSAADVLNSDLEDVAGTMNIRATVDPASAGKGAETGSLRSMRRPSKAEIDAMDKVEASALLSKNFGRVGGKYIFRGFKPHTKC